MITSFEKFIERQRESIKSTTPGPWIADLGNWQIESKHEDFYRDGICSFAYASRDGIGRENSDFDHVINPIDPVNDAEFIVNTRNTAEIQLEMLQVMMDELNCIEPIYGFETRKPCEICNYCMTRAKIQQLAEKALEAK